MAITKLMNIKASKLGSPSTGLKNCIHYILKPEKTSGGLWVGGNAGSTPEEILDTFLQTKRRFEKMDKRQGYHFVISFDKKDQVSAERMYQVATEFCEEYLGEHYDYCLAVHTDQPHMHAHICFNSVSRTDGLKYQYKDGDWEKYIQPVTDAICQKYGLPELKFEKGKRKGMSRAEYNAQKEQRPNRKQQLAIDIDTCIQRTGTYEEFLELLRIGYTVEEHIHRKTGMEYLFVRGEGWKHGIGSYTLGDEYQVDTIKKRIGMKKENVKKTDMESREPPTGIWIKASCFYQQKFILYANQIAELQSPFAVTNLQEFYTVRKHMRHIDRIVNEIDYLVDQDIRSAEQLEAKRKEVIQSISEHQKLKRQFEKSKEVLGTEKENHILRALYREKKMLNALQEFDVSLPQSQPQPRTKERDRSELQRTYENN